MKPKVTYHKRTVCWGDAPIFRTDEDAHHWAVGQGAFATLAAAAAAYTHLQQRYPVGTWAHWLGHVARRINK